MDLVEHVQDVLLCELGLTEKEALLQYRLAPLGTRRDMALLGVIHRAVLGLGPPQFLSWFPLATPAIDRPLTRLQHRRHNRQVVDYCEVHFSSMLARSALGLVREYNLLPQAVVKAPTVKDFQQRLQSLVRKKALGGCDTWDRCLSRSGGHLASWRRLSGAA